jgi:NAD(P)-dependent dehydrogenase (short-subunit alcohol dehydrogenase family)
MDQQGTSPATLITGASTGIGRACALRLDGLGWRVFAGVRKDIDGEALERDASDRLTWLRLDVTDAAQIRAAGDQVHDAVGSRGLDALINNAGIVVAAPVEIVPIDQLRRQLEINTIGAIAVTQAMLPMLRAARGRIVNVSSISGRVAFPVLGPYAASKFALGALSDAMRIELHDEGIRVTCIEPGSVKTPIWDKSLASGEAMLGEIPPERMDRYRPMMLAARDSAMRKNDTAMPVEVVVDRIVRALTTTHPKAHDVIGRNANIMRLVTAFLPWRLRDRLFAAGLRKMVAEQRGN